MHYKPFFWGFLMMSLFASCSKDVLTGSGPVVTREIPVSDVTSVALHYGIPLDIRKAASSRLVVSGYENLIQEMPNQVRNGHLDVTIRHGYERVRNNNLQAVLYTPHAVSSIVQHGSSTLGIWGFEDAAALLIKQHGSGDVTIQQSSFKQVEIRIHGSGNIQMSNAPVNVLDIAVHGSGQAYIWPKQNLNVTIHGSGNIYYKGNPAIVSAIHGSGKIIKVE